MTSALLTGYAIVAPPEMLNANYAYLKSMAELAKPLSRKFERFSCRSGAEAISACERAFSMAKIDTNNLGDRFGLYVNQAGHQHSDIDDYHDAINQWREKQKNESLLKHLWQSRSVSPFLAIKGLGNNLLGMISIFFNLRGDCCAFVRDEVGAISALKEAMFNLQHGYIDTALVVSAGSSCDYLEKPFSKENEQAGFAGAVALILQRASVTKAISIAQLNQVNLSCSHPPSCSVNKTQSIFQVLNDKYLYLKEEPRWGGILSSIAWLSHHFQNKVNNQHQIELFSPSSSEVYIQAKMEFGGRG